MKPIPADLRIEGGRALATWGPAGWGPAIQRGKYRHGAFSDELVAALGRLVGRWQPQPGPGWVAWVPSHRHPDLVASFAQRLAVWLDLPAVDSLCLTRAADAQKGKENSAQQFANVHGAFAVRGGGVPAAPVLLVDDMVDSRWTMTVVGAVLREAGSGPVFPLALAVTTSG